MILRNTASFSLFSVPEKVKLLLQLIYSRLRPASANRWELKNQKDAYDFVQINGFALSKHINSRLVKVKISADVTLALRKYSSDFQVFNQVFIYQEYGKLIEIIDQFRQRDNILTIVDAGANIGLTSVYFGFRFPRARFELIEADSKNAEVARVNIGSTTLQATVHHRALWTSASELSIDDSFRDRAEWAKSVREATDNNSSSVRGITLDNIFSLLNISIIDILKIDVEGAEKELFEDSNFVTGLRNVRFLAIEIHQEVVKKEIIFEALRGQNFEIFDRDENTYAFNVRFLKT